MSRSLRPRAAGAAVAMSMAALLIVGGSIAAAGSATSNGMTLSITSATVVARGAGVAVSVGAVCQPLDGNSALAAGPAGGGFATVSEVSGRTVVTASGDLLPFDAPLTCDGSFVNHISTTLTLAAGSAPFKPGDALVDVSLGAFDPANFFGGNDYGDTGQTIVRLVAH